MIIYNRQNIDRKDVANVSSALLQDKITTGKYVDQFENALKKYLKVNFVLTCNSGTSALMMAVDSLKLRKNSNVIIPAINFVAAANICKFFGYNIFFSDVDRNTGLMTSKELQKCIKDNKLKKVDLIFTMHLGGKVEESKNFYKIKKKLNCFLVEDACHAFGSDYLVNNKIYRVGSCTHVDISTFSFHALKTITTGEGGAVTTNNKILYQRLKNFRSHGMIGKSNMSYEINDVGFNFRLSDINCALGLSQLKKIKSILKIRRNIYKMYVRDLDKFKDIINLVKNNTNYSSCHLLLAKIDFVKLKIDKEQFFKKMKNKGIICQFHYIPLYKFKNHSRKYKLPNSEFYFKNFISLPIHCKLKKNHIRFVINNIKMVINKNLKKTN